MTSTAGPSAADELRILQRDLAGNSRTTTERLNHDIDNIRNNPNLLKAVILASGMADTKKAGLPTVTVDNAGSIHVEANGTQGSKEVIQEKPGSPKGSASLVEIDRDKKGRIVAEYDLDGGTKLTAEQLTYDAKGLSSYTDPFGNKFLRQADGNFEIPNKPFEIKVSVDDRSGTTTAALAQPINDLQESVVRQANGLTTRTMTSPKDPPGKSAVDSFYTQPSAQH